MMEESLRSSIGVGVYIITGASSGIGRACALAFIRQGAKVVAAARSKDLLEDLKREAGAKNTGLILCPADVTQDEDCRRLMRQALEAFGRVDGLVNNAGIGLNRVSWETSFEEYEAVMNVNYFGSVRMTLEVLPHFLSRNAGHIINVASIAARRAFPNAAAYCASKFALRGFTEALRQELKAQGKRVLVSLVYPVATHTPFFKKAGYEDYEKSHQHTQILHPEEVASEICKVALNGGGDYILTRRARIIDKVHALMPRWVEWLNTKALNKTRNQKPETRN